MIPHEQNLDHIIALFKNYQWVICDMSEILQSSMVYNDSLLHITHVNFMHSAQIKRTLPLFIPLYPEPPCSRTPQTCNLLGTLLSIPSAWKIPLPVRHRFFLHTSFRSPLQCNLRAPCKILHRQNSNLIYSYSLYLIMLHFFHHHIYHPPDRFHICLFAVSVIYYQ